VSRSRSAWPQPGGPPLLVVATGPYAGEGFDCPALDTLFPAAPVAHKGRLTQYVGRIVRSHERKATAEVHDYHALCRIAGRGRGSSSATMTTRREMAGRMAEASFSDSSAVECERVLARNADDPDMMLTRHQQEAIRVVRGGTRQGRGKGARCPLKLGTPRARSGRSSRAFVNGGQEAARRQGTGDQKPRGYRRPWTCTSSVSGCTGSGCTVSIRMLTGMT